ncbi:MAG: aminotransferase class V-fold PLP-dependent enzyme [Chitinophagales bacterium]
MNKGKIKEQFLLNQDIHFLNHGSFGACPLPVFQDYQKWQAELEKEPIQFFTKTGISALKASKEVFAQEFNCSVEDFFFTSNPSTAFNTVVKNLDLKPGDEILSTNLEYGAMDRTWNYYCQKTGAKYVQQEIPLPFSNKEEILEAFWSGYNKNTKIVFLSHITSSTALILPVEEICERAKELGLITIIDGAHVPGHIPLDLGTLKADFYTGAMHKWYLAPKGLAFLHVKKEFQDMLDPLIVSWGYESDFPSGNRFLDYHEFNGTRDFSAHLCMPSLKRFREDFEWDAACTAAKQRILEIYPKFCTLLGSEALCPLSSDFLGQMCSIPINTTKPLELKEALYNRFHIEIPITNLKSKYFIRISLQGYNNQGDIDTLHQALRVLMEENQLINS